MDEGHSKELLREAERAADDAAREARAEVLDSGSIKDVPDAPKRSKRRAAKQKKQSESDSLWHSFVVDVWLTDRKSVV